MSIIEENCVKELSKFKNKMDIKINKILKKYQSLPINLKASLWFLISAFFQRGISVITTPIFTRLMTTAEYGEFSVFYSWYGIITIFVTLNLFFGVYVRGLVKFEKERDVFSSSMEGLTLVLVLSWVLIYFLFSDQFNRLFSLNTKQMLCMFLVIWSSSAFSFWAAEQRVDLRYKQLVGLSVIVVILTPVTQLILMELIEDKVMARIYGLTIVNVILYVPLFVIQMCKGRVFFSAHFWKYALLFNIPLIPHYLSQSVLNSADRLMINSMIGSSEAGIYSLAYAISQIMTIFNSSMMQTMEPWLYKKIRDNQVKEISKVAYPAFGIIAFVNLALIVLAPEVIALFAPEEYYAAIWIIPPVAMSVYFQFSYTFFAVFEFYYEKTQYITAATLGGAVVNIILNYIFIGLFGYFAAGYTTLVCFVLYAMFHYIFMSKLVKENHPGIKVYDLKILLTITGIFVAAGFGILLTYNHPFIRYGLILMIVILLAFNNRSVVALTRKFLNIRKDA